MLTVFQYRGKSSIEETTDFFFSPARNLFGGKKINVIQTCSKENGSNLKSNSIWRECPIQHENSYLETILSVAFLLPFTIIGGAFYVARAIFGNQHAMEAKYREAVENKTVVDKPLERKHVVIVKDQSICDEAVLRLFKDRYSNDTEFSFIDGSRYKNASKADLAKGLPKTDDYDLFFVQQQFIIYFFDVEGCFTDAALDLYKSRSQKTLVKIIKDDYTSSPIEHVERVIEKSTGEYQVPSFELEFIPKSFLKV